MSWLPVAFMAAGPVAFINLARHLADQIARTRHWRVGRHGRWLCLTARVGERCYRCGTDYRWVHGHPTPYQRDGDTYGVVPLCNTCWFELTPAARLPFYGLMLLEWKAAGVYDGRPAGAWDTDREAIYAAVTAGL